MKTQGNTILITGGATGIGFALAERLGMSNTIVICGRRQDRLDLAKARLPSLHTIRCDISKQAERRALFKKIKSDFKGVNILINNAGIQKPIDLRRTADAKAAYSEIDTNLKAQVHLSMLFIPLLSKQPESAIMNVSSGLGFIPLARFPVYSATKAALHSFTLSLRHQLKGTSIKVFELIPPTVHDTELKGKPIEKADWSVSATEVAEAAINGIEKEEPEIAVGPTKKWTSASRNELDQIFGNINRD